MSVNEGEKCILCGRRTDYKFLLPFPFSSHPGGRILSGCTIVLAQMSMLPEKNIQYMLVLAFFKCSPLQPLCLFKDRGSVWMHSSGNRFAER